VLRRQSQTENGRKIQNTVQLSMTQSMNIDQQETSMALEGNKNDVSASKSRFRKAFGNDLVVIDNRVLCG